MNRITSCRCSTEAKPKLPILRWPVYAATAFKGPNVGSFDPQTGELVRFFNPRTDGWESHFQFDLSGEISPLTPEGRVTVLIFRLNDDDRVVERRLLYDVGLFS